MKQSWLQRRWPELRAKGRTRFVLVYGLLLCGGSQERQAAALEALIRAVEGGRLPVKRVEDAMARQRRAKERFHPCWEPRFVCSHRGLPIARALPDIAQLAARGAA